jgi:tyrosyl-tRNA synthetase
MENIFNQSSFQSIEPCKFYLGIDPTSTKLHIGHFYLFKVCDFLISRGFKMTLLIGDKTAKIGDPTDKAKTRKILKDLDIKHNVEEILKQIPKIDFEIIYNSTFNHEISFFSNFSVSNLLSNKTFSSRLENNEGVSLLEFIYPVFQGLDFYFLRRDNDVKLQIGGQDQWFNMVTGLNFISKKFDDCNIATLPLIVSKSGEKIGKTQNVKEDLGAFEIWQHFRNVRDENVIPLLKTITVDYKEIDNINNLKILLSNLMVEFIFSKRVAQDCEKRASLMYIKKQP